MRFLNHHARAALKIGFLRADYMRFLEPYAGVIEAYAEREPESEILSEVEGPEAQTKKIAEIQGFGRP
jgi:hypothetical protein